jgi:hypothetical protein
MKRVHSALLLASLVLCTAWSGLEASLDFGNKHARISIGSGSRLHVNTNNMSIDGTLDLSSSSTVTSRNAGAIIAFNRGQLVTDGLDATLTGSFNPTGSDTISLAGNGHFSVQPGTVIQGVNVSGIANTILGQPIFSSPIVLADEDTELSLGIQSVLEHDIKLNDGSLTLADNLILADNARIMGDGVVILNKRRLDLGSTYTNKWTGDISFYDALDMTLNGSVQVSGAWTFVGNNVVNGNGAVLDLSGGGVLRVGIGSSLQLNDIVIKGLGDGEDFGQLTFGSTDAVIKTSNVTLQLDNHYTLSGNLYVTGPTTLALGEHDFALDDEADLTVDGATLWMDPLDAKANPGVVYTPAGSTGVSTMLNGGVIRAVSAKNVATQSLITDRLTGDVVLDASVTLEPGQRIVVSGEVSVDGNGSYVEFLDPNFPQIIMLPDSKLTLKNIEFRNLKANSFDFRPTTTDLAAVATTDESGLSANVFANGVIRIDKNVKWEMDQDITFTNGRIHILDTEDLVNTFVMTSRTTPKTFRIAPLLDVYGGTSERNADGLLLGHNTLQLENATLRGLDHIQIDSSGQVASPAIALSGNAGVDQDTVNNSINLFIEKDNNHLVLRNSLPPTAAETIEAFANDLVAQPHYTEFQLNNNIRFGDYPINHLTISFSTTATTQPMVTIDNDPGIQLFSANGLASLEFSDKNVLLNLANSNAFIIDSHSSLAYNNLSIQNFPIKQQASDFNIAGPEIGGAGIDASFARLPGRVKRYKNLNALEIKHAAEAKALTNARPAAAKKGNKVVGKASKKGNQKEQKAVARAKKQSPRAYFRDLDELLENTEHMQQAKELATRSLPVTRGEFVRPESFGTVIPKGARQFSTTGYTGNVSGDTVYLGGFNATTKQQVGFTMQDPFVGVFTNSTLEIGTNTEFNEDHKLNFEGLNNKVAVFAGNTTIDCSTGLGLAEGTELVLEVTGASTITLNGELNLPIGCKFVLSTSSTHPDARFILGDGFSVVMGGKTIDDAPSFEMRNGAYVALAGVDGEPDGIRVTGIGSFVVGERAILNTNGNKLIFGADDVMNGHEKNVDLNHITFKTEPGAKLFLNSTLSFRICTYSLDLRGCLVDANGGVFALNAAGTANDGAAVDQKPGKLLSVNWNDGGSMNLHGGATFVMGENEHGRSDFIGFGWDGKNAVFKTSDGTGLIHLVRVDDGYNKSFKANINDFNPEVFNNAVIDADAELFVKAAASQVAAVRLNTVYKIGDVLKVRSQNTRNRRTKTAVLASGAQVLEEAADGLTVSGDYNGSRFTVDMVNGTVLSGDASVLADFVQAPRV